MEKYILLLFLFLICTPALADTIPHQSKELIEIYTRQDPIMYKDLELRHTYKVFDEIFILPNEFYGEAELYDLKFYIDMDISIENDYDANCYRILYENRMPTVEYKPIPEPTTIVLLTLGFLTLFLRKRNAKIILE